MKIMLYSLISKYSDSYLHANISSHANPLQNFRSAILFIIIDHISYYVTVSKFKSYNVMRLDISRTY